MQDDDTGHSEKRFVPRLLASDGIHLLEEAQKHPEMEIYQLVAEIIGLIDDYESEEQKSEVIYIPM